MSQENQFIYFVCVNGNKQLLKKEIELFHKDLSPSFSMGDFLTYKNKGESLSLNQLESMTFSFALDWGINEIELKKEIIEDFVNKRQVMIDLPSAAPSRAYLKIAEACKKYDVDSNNNLNWIEFGSGPGGASFYLLNNFNKVVGIDPGDMDPICLDNNNFTHIKKPIQSTLWEDMPKMEVDWIASDMNINPKQAIKEVLRHAKGCHKNLKGVFMTIKMVKTDHVKLIPDFEQMFIDFGFSTVVKSQLPSHKKEFLIFASNK